LTPCRSISEGIWIGVKSGEFNLPRGVRYTLVARLIVNSIEKIQLNMTFSTENGSMPRKWPVSWHGSSLMDSEILIINSFWINV
jgi:hypothetical protein